MMYDDVVEHTARLHSVQSKRRSSTDTDQRCLFRFDFDNDLKSFWRFDCYNNDFEIGFLFLFPYKILECNLVW